MFQNLYLFFFRQQDYITVDNLDESINEVAVIRDGSEKLWELASESHGKRR